MQTSMNPATQRVVALVDMDCFYCQVEARINPSLKGKPVAVVQYNQWKGGGIIAVNYEARALGVSRHMRGDKAKEKCPEIVLVPVPTVRGKADLSNYRDAGDEVAKVFSKFSDCVQRASIDEAYLDLTKAVQDSIKNDLEEIKSDDLPNTHVVGYCNSKSKDESERKKGLIEWLKHVDSQKTSESADYMLAVGGKIVEKMREEIFNTTGFHCSAGIAHNKILAKLIAGLNKPRKQTILPQDSLPELYETLPLYKVRSLGGKLGKIVSEKLSITYMSELYKFSLQELLQKFDEKTSSWLYNIARGIDLDPVTSRLRPESIGCCKNFTGKNMLTKRSEVEHWMKELASEISERLMKDLERNKRRAKLLTVMFARETSMTRCGALNSYEVNRIKTDALDLIKKFNSASPNVDAWSPPIKYLGLSVSKFTEELSSIEKYFKNFNNVEVSEKSHYKNSDSVVEKSQFTSSDPPQFEEKSETANSDQVQSTEKHEPTNSDQSQFTERSKISKFVCEGSSKKEKTLNTAIDKYFKSVNNSNVNETPGTSKEQTSSSFFLEFLNKNKELISENRGEDITDEKQDETQEEEDEETEENWISLTEVFPDVNEVDDDVIEILPEAFRKKIKQRLNSNETEDITVVSETCKECGKSIPLKEFPEHSDYHAALKLHSEINKTNSVNGAILIKNKPKEPEIQSKRKKRVSTTPVKKMKSITSFFTAFPK